MAMVRTTSLLTHALVFLLGATLVLLYSSTRLFLPLSDPPHHRNATVGASLMRSGNDQGHRNDNQTASNNDTSPTRLKLPSFDDGHGHKLPPECTRDATPTLFEQWRQSKEILCQHGDMSVEKYTMKRWETQPAFVVYRNVHMTSLYTKGAVNCVELKRVHDEYKAGSAPVASTMTHPVIRVKAFDPFNPYERFHSHLNVAMAMSMFEIRDPQILDIIPADQVKYDRGVPQHDREMYASFSSVEPIIVSEGSDKSNVTFVPYMVDSFDSGTSMLVTKTGGSFRGRGADHHCKSSLFQGMTRWMKHNLLGNEIESGLGGNGPNESETIQVTWSSRAPYCCRPKGKVYTPKRPTSNENELLRRVGQALGERYNITILNFGNVNIRDSVRAASNSHIIVGVHGAGLVWSAFLPPHAGLVEIFGGDRGSSNRHYHNIASLADVHYRSLGLRGGMAGGLGWDDGTVDEIVWKIRSIDFRNEPGASEPPNEKPQG